MADENAAFPDSHTSPGQPPAQIEPVSPLDNHRPVGQVKADLAASPSKALLTSMKEMVWSKNTPHPHPQNESVREVVETVVFVVVLVLLLKSFVAEAFVIPTGSMADTLLGYQKFVTCPQCGYEFPVNCSQEVDPQDGGPAIPVTECLCQNCQLRIHLVNPQRDGRDPSKLASNEVIDPGPNSGDRVLVDKYIYDFQSPERWDIVVFKYPAGPQKNWVQMNYIKRLDGRPGEWIGIWYGDLFVIRSNASIPDMSGVPVEDRWGREYSGNVDDNDMSLREGNPYAHIVRSMKELAQATADRLKAGDPGTGILRKPPDKVLAEARMVYDNDHPAKDLIGVQPPRWAGVDDDGAWSTVEPHGFRHTSKDGERLDMLRYRHILRGHDRPSLITDFLAYNTYFPRRPPNNALAPEPTPPNWVGDLTLEFEVKVEDPKGELVTELSRGVDRFRAVFDLSSGECKLFRLRAPHDGNRPPTDEDFNFLEVKAPTALKGKGTHKLRFANVDARLIVWVDGSLVFGDGVSYDLPRQRGPYPNDLQPASIGVKGGTVSVHHVKLSRDTYYTINPRMGADGAPEGNDWGDPSRWGTLHQLPAKTLYVQPGHFLCLGDNSPESSDGRDWGAVPERLLLGRALLVYYPFYFPYWPLKSPVNRVGPIE